MPIENSGKVKVGQEVLVYLTNYPYQEFGKITGRVTHIAAVPNDTHYSIQITFPNGLVTTSKKLLPFQQNMKGEGEIITENLRLIQRFFHTIRETLRT